VILHSVGTTDLWQATEWPRPTCCPRLPCRWADGCMQWPNLDKALGQEVVRHRHDAGLVNVVVVAVVGAGLPWRLLDGCCCSKQQGGEAAGGRSGGVWWQGSGSACLLFFLTCTQCCSSSATTGRVRDRLQDNVHMYVVDTTSVREMRAKKDTFRELLRST